MTVIYRTLFLILLQYSFYSSSSAYFSTSTYSTIHLPPLTVASYSSTPSIPLSLFVYPPNHTHTLLLLLFLYLYQCVSIYISLPLPTLTPSSTLLLLTLLSPAALLLFLFFYLCITLLYYSFYSSTSINIPVFPSIPVLLLFISRYLHT